MTSRHTTDGAKKCERYANIFRRFNSRHLVVLGHRASEGGSAALLVHGEGLSPLGRGDEALEEIPDGLSVPVLGGHIDQWVYDHGRPVQDVREHVEDRVLDHPVSLKTTTGMI